MKGSRKRVVNMPLFINRYDLGFDVDVNGDINYYRWGGNTFNVINDTVDVTTVDAQVSYIVADKINVIARGEYYMYAFQTQPEAWHLPDWKATLSGSYNVKEKIIIKADIFAISERKALVYDSTSTFIGIDEIGVSTYVQTLPWMIDINLGIEYRYNKKLSAFVNFNNIAAMNYYQWNKYPSQGFNLLGGLTYSFWEK
jgi:outer membrane receptor protein involved in Fe transport